MSTFHPGTLADVETQTAPLLPVTQRIGDTLLFGYKGAHYDASRLAEYTAEQLADLLRTRRYGDVILNAIPMAGIPVYEAIGMLRANRTDMEYSALIHMTAIDAVSSWQDLQGDIHRIGAPLASAYPFGGITNHLPFVRDGDIPLTLWRDELESFAWRNTPSTGSLRVDTFVDWRSTLDDVVDGASARRHMENALAPETPTLFIEPVMGHAAIEASPNEAREALRTANTWHTVLQRS